MPKMTHKLFPVAQTLTMTLTMTLTFFVGSVISTSALSQSPDEIITEAPQEVERWFGALGSVNRRDFNELIADDTIIVLKDLGVKQSKSEFIAALDEWEKATRDANIVYRYESIDANSASVLVCYRFTSNEQLNLESFTYSNGQITGSIQEFKSVDCADM